MKSILVLAALALMGCTVHGEDKPAAKETYTNALLRVDTSIRGLSETVGNQTAELNDVKEQMKGLRNDFDALQKLLKVADEPAKEVPKVDAPPVEQAGQRITFNGKAIDLANFLKSRAATVEIVGDVDAHLRAHGYAGDFSGLSRDQKIRLHSVAHATGQPAKSTTKVVVRSSAPVMIPQSSNCANGNCANPQYGYQQRRGLFGRWR